MEENYLFLSAKYAINQKNVFFDKLKINWINNNTAIETKISHCFVFPFYSSSLEDSSNV